MTIYKIRCWCDKLTNNNNASQFITIYNMQWYWNEHMYIKQELEHVNSYHTPTINLAMKYMIKALDKNDLKLSFIHSFKHIL